MKKWSLMLQVALNAVKKKQVHSKGAVSIWFAISSCMMGQKISMGLTATYVECLK